MIANLFVGLFLQSISFLKQDVTIISTDIVNSSKSVVASEQHFVVNSKHYRAIPEFSIAVLFVLFLAMYRCTSFKQNVAILIFKIVAMCFIAPLLIMFGCYIDGVITIVVLLARFCYLSYFWFRFKRFEFVFYNVSTLMFVHGRAAPYLRSSHNTHYVTLYGGLNYMCVDDLALHFVNPMLVKLAIRGLVQLDLNVVRSIELLNGDFIYIFSPEPVVGVYNAAFDREIVNEIDLKESIYEIPDSTDSD
ncbi:non-structural protein 3c [Ferret coronavirus]|uniref:Non-structural protein 3c n=1 Tax=Ferret coronavirus TaxID=1264898 RepID=A0A172AZB2_9ALPC|nr:non-structural protein 3c [Ferret coronavirus]AKG92641.1 non-structural protein 3c [Ferret coronavirus]